MARGAKYKPLPEKKIRQIASDKKVSFTDIMSWFSTCASFPEKVDMTKIMRKRMENIIALNKIW